MQVKDNEKSIPSSSPVEPEPVPGSTLELVQLGSLEDDINWLFPTTTIPTGTPKLPMQRLRLYVNGATKRLYIYNVKTAVWSYTTLT